MTSFQHARSDIRAEIVADIKATGRRMARSATEMHALCCRTSLRIAQSRELIARVDAMLDRNREAAGCRDADAARDVDPDRSRVNV